MSAKFDAMIGAIESIASRKGKLRNRSVTKEITPSTRPREYPASRPSATPIKVENSVATKAITIEVRNP